MEKTNDERRWIIYMYTFPNGKRYIGKTCQTLKQRQGSTEFISYKVCPVLWRAIQKYGVENIQQEILFENYMPDDYASRLEMLCIALFKTNCNRYRNPQYGYNVTDGGEGSSGCSPSEETREKIRIAHIGKKASEETKKRMSKSQRKRRINSENNPFYGKHHSEETKEKLRKASTGRHHTEEAKEKISKRISGYNNYQATAVYCVELNRVFFTLSEAQNETGADRHMVKWCCDGEREIVKNYHWRYATQDEIIAEKQRRGIEVA